MDISGIKTNEDHFHTVGLPDAAVRESRDRVRAALKNRGYDIPSTHITINLASANIRKEGSGFDLPIALGILGAYGGLNKKDLPDCLFVGDLSLDGGIRGVRSTLPIAIEARGKKISRLIVPELNAREAAMVGGVEVYPVKSLLAVIRFVNTGNGILPLKVDSDSWKPPRFTVSPACSMPAQDWSASGRSAHRTIFLSCQDVAIDCGQPRISLLPADNSLEKCVHHPCALLTEAAHLSSESLDVSARIILSVAPFQLAYAALPKWRACQMGSEKRI